MPTILVFDGHDEQRAEIRDLLHAHGDDWRVLDTGCPREFLGIVEEQPVDLVVTEAVIADGERDGESTVLDEIRRSHVRVPILVLTDGDTDEVEALIMGAASYVPRSIMARDLVAVANRLLTLAGCRRRHARLLDGLTATEVKFRITGNDRGMIPVLVGYLLDGFEEFGLSGDGNRIQLAVALEEAMTNGIVHGNLEVSSKLRDLESDTYESTIRERRVRAPYAHRILSVVGHYARDVAAIEIRDEGPGFDPRRIADPTAPENLERPHGRGLYLIRSFTDEVRFNDTGNAITLIVRRPDDPTDDGSATDAEGVEALVGDTVSGLGGTDTDCDR